VESSTWRSDVSGISSQTTGAESAPREARTAYHKLSVGD
jgi:hypothetical protein